jgi:hypothetical protein
VPVAKHLPQAEQHGPSKEPVDPKPAWQLEVDAIRQARGIAHGLKLMAVNPGGKRATHLAVFK